MNRPSGRYLIKFPSLLSAKAGNMLLQDALDSLRTELDSRGPGNDSDRVKVAASLRYLT